MPPSGRLLRTLLHELSLPATSWGSHVGDLRHVWACSGHPVRAGLTVWRPFETVPWTIQARLLEAAAARQLVFGIFAALAEYERALISERTVAGLAAARAPGRKGGRPYKLTGPVSQPPGANAAPPPRR